MPHGSSIPVQQLPSSVFADPHRQGIADRQSRDGAVHRIADSAPEAMSFVKKFSWENKVVNAVLAWKDNEQADAEETAEYFIKNFESVWTQWVPAAIAAKVKAATS